MYIKVRMTYLIYLIYDFTWIGAEAPFLILIIVVSSGTPEVTVLSALRGTIPEPFIVVFEGYGAGHSMGVSL